MRLHHSETTVLSSGTPVNTGAQNAPHELIDSCGQTDWFMRINGLVHADKLKGLSAAFFGTIEYTIFL